jgi:hypothetical protein
MVHRPPNARQTGDGDSPRRWRIPLRTLTKFASFLAAVLGLIRVIRDLWIQPRP